MNKRDYIDRGLKNVNPENVTVILKYRNRERIVSINDVPFNGPYSFKLGSNPSLQKAESLRELKRIISEDFMATRPDLVKLIIFSD